MRYLFLLTIIFSGLLKASISNPQEGEFIEPFLYRVSKTLESGLEQEFTFLGIHSLRYLNELYHPFVHLIMSNSKHFFLNL